MISSSRYKLNGIINVSDFVDKYIIDFAEQMASIWSLSKAFVLDTYVTNNKIGIVEIGGICHAGFYKTDIQKIVIALNEIIK
jgi:endonuclease IV